MLDSIEILKKNTYYNKKQYTILSILKFAVNLEPYEIKNFLKNNENNNENTNFLQIIKNIDTIHFEKSINMFHDLNDLIITNRFSLKIVNENLNMMKNLIKHQLLHCDSNSTQ